MVSNAKSYNQKGSALFSNAERIRKIVSAGMMEVNPAYKDDNYAPFSAPVPEEPEEHEEHEEPVLERSQPHSNNSEAPSRRDGQSQSHNTPTTDREVEPSESTVDDFKGDTFEQAQERIISEMIRLKDKE